MDLTKTENIIYLTVACVVALFLFVTEFIVIGKGKRKCFALDVVYRIFVSICLAASIFLLVSAVLTNLDGSVRIDTSVDPCILVLGGTTVELPLSALFVTLHESYVAELNVALLVLSIVALSADCMLANLKDKSDKKKGKKKVDNKTASAKSPDQAKRDADIERIRRLADSAVQKSESACETKSRAEEPTKTAHEEEPQDFDWRVEDPRKTEFIGIGSSGSGFDNFDDDFVTPETADGEPTEEYAEPQASEPLTEEETSEEEQQTEYGSQSGEEPTEEETQFDDEPQAEEEPQTDDYDEPDASDEPQSLRDDGYDESHTHSAEYKAVDGYGEAYADDVEPNRDIYIPKIRTIVRKPSAAATKPTASRKSGAKKKPSGGAKSGGKSAVKKTANKSSGGGKTTAGKTARKSDPETKAKTLPVTKRYVILDRTSAVNIFSEYLKERDKAEKDRLEASIETIILK